MKWFGLVFIILGCTIQVRVHSDPKGVEDLRIKEARAAITARLAEPAYTGQRKRLYPVHWVGNFVDSVWVKAVDFETDTVLLLWTYRCGPKGRVPEWLVRE